MKAYRVDLESNPDAGTEIIFAENTKEARKKAYCTDVAERRESFLDVKVLRYPAFDGKEILSNRELMKEQWRGGWWFFQDGCPPCHPSYSTDEDFYNWYDSIWKNNEVEK